MASPTKSLMQTLHRYIKKPWENHGPRRRSRIPIGASQSHRIPPFLPPGRRRRRGHYPHLSPRNRYDIKYFARDQRRNRPAIKRTVLRKADVEKMMTEKIFDMSDFLRPYLTAKVVKDDNAIGGGYQK